MTTLADTLAAMELGSRGLTGFRHYLRAERRPDGQRTFRVPPGEPLPTSYGEDLHQQVFGTHGHRTRDVGTLTPP